MKRKYNPSRSTYSLVLNILTMKVEIEKWTNGRAPMNIKISSKQKTPQRNTFPTKKSAQEALKVLNGALDTGKFWN